MGLFQIREGRYSVSASMCLSKPRRRTASKNRSFIMLILTVVGNSGKRPAYGNALQQSRNVLQTQLNLEKSDNVPSTVARFVTIIAAASLNSVQIYRIFERTVPCPLRLFYFCFIRTDLYCSWSVVSQSELLRMWQLVVEK
jgi:hypothetical protein